MEIETRINVKTDDGDIVSADVLLYNEKGDVVKKVCIIESEVLKELQDTISNYESAYISLNDLKTILRNSSEDTVINATKIAGLSSDEIALKSEIPLEFDPISHESITTKYGAGTTSKYGHVKTRNDLSAVTFSNGEALSAYQGKILNDKIRSLQESDDKFNDFLNLNALQIIAARYRPDYGVDGLGEQILSLIPAYNHGVVFKVISNDDSINLEGKQVVVHIEGLSNMYALRVHANNNGEYFTDVLNINLKKGNYWADGIVETERNASYVSATTSCILRVGDSTGYQSFH